MALHKATSPDFGPIATLHAAGITTGFLSTLGTPFLSTLYRGIERAPASGVLVAEDQQAVLGFVAFTRDTGAMYRWILTRQTLPLLWALLPNLLRLSVYRRCFETLLYPFRRHNGQVEAETPDAPEPELLSIAVSEAARGRGIGKLLVQALEEKFRSMGVQSYLVVTSAEDPRSNAFYRACGFAESRRFLNHGKPMQEYRRSLTEGPSQAALTMPK